MRTNELLYWKKYMLALRGAEYFYIGKKKMRRIADENKAANFLLESGSRVMIKRKFF